MGIDLETKEKSKNVVQTSSQNDTKYSFPNYNNIQPPENMLQKESIINKNEEIMKSNMQNGMNPTNFSQNILSYNQVLNNIKEVGETQVLQDSDANMEGNETMNNNAQPSQINQEQNNINVNNMNSGENSNNVNNSDIKQSSSLKNTNLDDFIKKSQEMQNIENMQNMQNVQNMENMQNMQNMENKEPTDINPIPPIQVENQESKPNLDINTNNNIDSNNNMLYLNIYNNNENNDNQPESNYDFSANIFKTPDDNNNNINTNEDTITFGENNLNINDYNINFDENNNNNLITNENTGDILANNDYNNIITENYDNYITTSPSNENIQYETTLPIQYLPEKIEDNNFININTDYNPDINANINTDINTDIPNTNIETKETNYNMSSDIYGTNTNTDYNMSSDIYGATLNQGQQMEQKPLIEENPAQTDNKVQSQFIDAQNIYDNPITNTEAKDNKNQGYLITNPDYTSYIDPKNEIPQEVKDQIIEKQQSNVFDKLKESKTFVLDKDDKSEVNDNKNSENENKVIPEEVHNENNNDNDNENIKLNEEKKEENEIQNSGVKILPTQYLKTTTRDVKVLSQEQLKDINNYYDNNENDNNNNINNEIKENDLLPMNAEQNNNLLNSNVLGENNNDNLNEELKKEKEKLNISDEIKEIKEMPDEPFAQRDYIFNQKKIKVIKIEEEETQFCADIISPLLKKIFG